MRKFAYLASVIATGASLGVSAPAALAQADAKGASAPAQSLEEIVVTARRREENAQSVPIAITAFSNEMLEQQNIKTEQDLNGLVPSLLVSAKGQASRNVEAFTLRGQAPTYQGSVSVVNYLAEVPLIPLFTHSQQGGPGNFIDLQNVQVLAGPQGTLFGRNSTGGAVLLVPQKPTEEFGGYIKGSAGNYDYNGLEGVLNVPVSGTLQVRAAGVYEDRDGFTRDVLWDKDRDDLHYYAGRIGVLWRPTDTFEDYLMGFGSDSSNNGTSYKHRSFNRAQNAASGDCFEGPGGSCDMMANETSIADRLGPYKVRLGVDAFEKTETWGVINKATLELSDTLSLINILSYQHMEKDLAYDLDGTPDQRADVGIEHTWGTAVPGITDVYGFMAFGLASKDRPYPRDQPEQWTAELQLQGTLYDDKLSYSLGAYYSDLSPDGEQLSIALFGGCPADYYGHCFPTQQYYGVENTSEALYGQGTLDLGLISNSLDGLKLTAGYRKTWDTVEGYNNFYVDLTALGAGYLCVPTNKFLTNPSTCRFEDKLDSDEPTWTVGLDYTFTDETLVYAKISRGYKSGGFNPYAVREETRIFDPEYLTSYEAGIKTDIDLGSVPTRVNAAVYSSRFKDSQIGIGDYNIATRAAGARITQADATINGIEFEATMRPSDHLEIGAMFSYTDAEWDDYKLTALGPSPSCDGLKSFGETIDRSCTDYGTPEWVYNLHVSLDLPVPEEVGRINLFASYAYIDDQDQSGLPPGFDPAAWQPGSQIDSYGLVNLSAFWRNVFQSGFDLELFGNNVTDEEYINANSNCWSCGYWAEIYGAPRTYGGRVRYNF